MSSTTQQLQRIWPFFAPLRIGFIAAALATVVVAATEPLVPWLLQQILGHGFKDTSFPLWWVPLALLGVFGLRGSATYTANYALAWTALRGTESLRVALFTRMMSAHPRLYVERQASSLINTVAFEVQLGSQLLTTSVLDLLRDSLTLVALSAYLLWLNWPLTLFVLVLLPAVALVMRAIGRRMRRLTTELQAASDRMGYVVEENVLAWRTVRMHGAEPVQTARFEAESLALRKLTMKSAAATALATPITQMFAAAALSAVIVVALWRARHGHGNVADFVGFVTAMLMLIAPIKRLSEVVVPITRGLTSLERGLDLIHDAPTESGGSHAPARSRGELALHGVTVRFKPDVPPALDGVTLQVPAGQVLALVGPSGAGKSTLVNLLPRFIDATVGTVSVDGVPVTGWNVHALRRQFALVSQDVVLFNDSVAANVAFGQAMDEARVITALQAAQLWTTVQALPQGLHTWVGHNGHELSGGQRQRLAIARAIYKDAPILILDEATSALDTESERGVQAALETLMAGRTAIVIAHRLSTIERADRILVLDGGRIAEQGTRAELLAAGGLFARLHALQFSA